MLNPQRFSILLSSLTFTLLLASACGNPTPSETPEDSTAQTPNSEETATETPSETNTNPETNESSPVSQANQNTGQKYQVKVYFPKTSQNSSAGYIEPVWRETQSQGVAKFAIAQLIAGPGNSERKNGLLKPIALQGTSNCGEDFSLVIENKAAKLKFCREVTALGDLQLDQIQSAIESTLKQFPTVDKVAVLDASGQCFTTGDRSCLVQLQPPNKLTLTSLGGVEIGMTIAEASEQTGIQFVNQSSGGEEFGCLYYKAAKSPEDVFYMVTDGKIARIDIQTPKITTLSGAKIGDTEERIKALYPGKIETEPHEYVPNGKYLIFVPEDASSQNYRVIFETNEKGIVTTMRSGKLPEVTWIEGCV